MTMNNFENLYDSVRGQYSGFQKKIDIQSPISAYYGISPDGYLRLAFRSSVAAPKMESTKLLRVEQGKESNKVYWCCFDLLSNDAKSAFYAFCENLVEAIVAPSSSNEYDVLLKLRKRYISWKALFKKTPAKNASFEVIQGLFGELYFMWSYMIPKYGSVESVRAWGGSAYTSKDFAIGNDWFEVKTIGVNTACVSISSLGQLTADTPGRLVVIHAEHMPDEFSNGESSIPELLSKILSTIDDETIEGILLSQVAAIGVDITNPITATKFDCRSLEKYIVADGFPRITIETVPFPEITNVRYDISVAAIARFLEE